MNQLKLTSLLVAVAAALGLAACGDRNTTAAANKPADSAVAQMPQRADPALPPTDAVKDAVKSTAQTPSATSDSAITAAVKAELAKDAQLSTAAIDVDTANGKVALKGSAPNAALRDRAAQVASAVIGVVAVDNQLTVGSS